jgi:phosphoesterase RecJ-like protein
MKLTPSKEETKLKKLIEESEKILVTSHIRIDPDAVCSILITTDILEQLYPEKSIFPIIQESYYKWPINTEKIFPGIGTIENIPNEMVDLNDYDLVIVCDAGEIERCLPKRKGKTKVVIIDHHEIIPNSKQDVLINEKRSSNTEQLYITFKRIFNGNFSVNKDLATLIYFGIITDNGRFLYENVNSETFEVVAEIFDIAEVNPQLMEKNILRLNINSLKALREALNNMKCKKNFCYSYFTKGFVKKTHLTVEELTSGGKDHFLSNIVVNTKDVDWGFVVYPTSNNDVWKVSFRAFRDTENIEPYARALGGGGHIRAASSTITAKSAKEAVKIVLDTISQNPS